MVNCHSCWVWSTSLEVVYIWIESISLVVIKVQWHSNETNSPPILLWPHHHDGHAYNISLGNIGPWWTWHLLQGVSKVDPTHGIIFKFIREGSCCSLDLFWCVKGYLWITTINAWNWSVELFREGRSADGRSSDVSRCQAFLKEEVSHVQGLLLFLQEYNYILVEHRY